MKNEKCKIQNAKLKFKIWTLDVGLRTFGRVGFTLLEVMISLAIVGGLLVTLIYTLNYHLGIAERHRTITISTNLAKGKMYDMEENPVAGKGQFPEPYSSFSYETNIRDSLFPGMSEIQVVVGDGKETVKLFELIRKKSL